MRLAIAPPEWDLPSFDPCSLSTILYLRLAAIPYTVTVNPYLVPASPATVNSLTQAVSATPNGHEHSEHDDTEEKDNGKKADRRMDSEACSGPTLVHPESADLVHGHAILSFLQKHERDLDASCETTTVQLELVKSMIIRELAPAMEYLWFENDVDFNAVTRQLWSSHLSFPTSMFVPRQIRRHVLSRCERLGFHNERDAVASFEKCCATLSSQLNGHAFFGGITPCSLDALVGGYLGAAIFCTHSRAPFRTILRNYPELRDHVQRLVGNYLQDESSWKKLSDSVSSEEQWRWSSRSKGVPPEQVPKQDAEHDDQEAFMNKVFMGGTALSLVLYLAFTTFIRIEVS